MAARCPSCPADTLLVYILAEDITGSMHAIALNLAIAMAAVVLFRLLPADDWLFDCGRDGPGRGKRF